MDTQPTWDGGKFPQDSFSPYGLDFIQVEREKGMHKEKSTYAKSQKLTGSMTFYLCTNKQKLITLPSGFLEPVFIFKAPSCEL
jgi:hypothetical protein